MIAGHVPGGIIDDLELVQIQIQQRMHALGMTPHLVKRMGKPPFKFSAIDQPGERVVAGLVIELALQTLVLTDIMEHHDRADHMAFAIADRRGRILHVHIGAVAADKHRMLGQAHFAALAQAAAHGVFDDGALAGINDRQHLVDGLPARSACLPADQLFSGRIQIRDCARGIRGDHGIPNRPERDQQAFLFLEHRHLGELAFADIGKCALVMQQPALGIAQRAAVFKDYDLAPVAATQVQLLVAYEAVSLHRPQAGIALACMDMKILRAPGLAQLRFRVIAQHGHQRRIGGQDIAGWGCLVDTVDDIRKQLPPARLTAAQRVLIVASLDGNAGELGKARDGIELIGARRSVLGEVHVQSTLQALTGGDDRGGTAGSQFGGGRQRRELAPGHIGADILHDHLATHRRGGGTTAGTQTDLGTLECCAKPPGQRGRCAHTQARMIIIQQHHRAANALIEALQCAADRREGTLQRCVGSDELKHLALGMRHHLRALARRDIDETGADQSAARGWQTHEAHLAGQLPAVGISMQPLEHRAATVECPRHITALDAERWQAVGLQRC